MKKFLVTILSVLYMASAMGATLHVHYCMGKIAEVGFSHNEEDRCSKCGMKKADRNKGCCKDEYKTFKTNDHKISKAIYDFSHQIISSPGATSFDLRAQQFTDCFRVKNINYIPPLDHRNCPIFIKIRNFRI